LAVWTTPRQFRTGLALVVAADLASSAGPGGSFKDSVPFTVVTAVVVVLVRRVLGDRERRAQLAERERDLAAREAAVEERARIARELHDAIAHDVSMMVVQAGVRRSFPDDPPLCPRASTFVMGRTRSSSRSSMTAPARRRRSRAAGTAWSGCARAWPPYGGRLDAGRRPSGGFVVRVLLPIR
jgi:Histidine kinase